MVEIRAAIPDLGINRSRNTQPWIFEEIDRSSFVLFSLFFSILFLRSKQLPAHGMGVLTGSKMSVVPGWSLSCRAVTTHWWFILRNDRSRVSLRIFPENHDRSFSHFPSYEIYSVMLCFRIGIQLAGRPCSSRTACLRRSFRFLRRAL